jgi:cytochrome c oxidase assembly protein subunit 15
LAKTAIALLFLQILLGTATLRLHLQVEPLTVAHHTIGASLLGTMLAFTVLALRDQTSVAQTIPPSEGQADGDRLNFV